MIECLIAMLLVSYYDSVLGCSLNQLVILSVFICPICVSLVSCMCMNVVNVMSCHLLFARINGTAAIYINFTSCLVCPHLLPLVVFKQPSEDVS